MEALQVDIGHVFRKGAIAGMHARIVAKFFSLLQEPGESTTGSRTRVPDSAGRKAAGTWTVQQAAGGFWFPLFYKHIALR